MPSCRYDRHCWSWAVNSKGQGRWTVRDECRVRGPKASSLFSIGFLPSWWLCGKCWGRLIWHDMRHGCRIGGKSSPWWVVLQYILYFLRILKIHCCRKHHWLSLIYCPWISVSTSRFSWVACMKVRYLSKTFKALYKLLSFCILKQVLNFLGKTTEF